MKRLLIASAILFPSAAHAYIDPNTGGFFFQFLFPVFSFVLAALVVPKRFFVSLWTRAKQMFRKKGQQ